MPSEWELEAVGEGGDPAVTGFKFLPLILGRGDVRRMLLCPQLTDLERLALRVLYSGGVRDLELLALTGADVGESQNTLKVSGPLARTVVVDKHTWLELKALGRGPGEPLFELSPEGLAELVERAARGVGILSRFEGAGRRIQPKSLRHAFASHSLENGMDLFVLFNLMGCRFFNTCLMYVETAIARWWAGYAGHHPLMKGQQPPGMEKLPALALEASGRFAEGEEGEDDETIRGGDEQAHITIEETWAMMAAAQLINASEAERNYLILRLCYATALRVGELEELKFLDLEYEECRVFVRDGKEHRDRYTLMDPETARRLKAFQGERGWGESVFGISDRQIRNIVEAAGRATGLLEKYHALKQSLSPHSFRHAHGNHCYESGIDLFNLKKLVGHTGLETTIEYVECALPWQRSIYEQKHELSRHPLG